MTEQDKMAIVRGMITAITELVECDAGKDVILKATKAAYDFVDTFAYDKQCQ